MATPTPLDPRDPRVIRLLSYYRDAELRGAGLLPRMLDRETDPAARTNLVRHLSDEARHAALITQRTADLAALQRDTLGFSLMPLER